MNRIVLRIALEKHTTICKRTAPQEEEHVMSKQVTAECGTTSRT